MNFRLTALAWAAALLFTASVGWGEEKSPIAGEAKAVSGKVVVVAEGGKSAEDLALGRKLFAGDEVRVAQGGQATILLTDGGLLKLAGETNIEIGDRRLQPEETPFVILLLGRLWAKAEHALGGGSSFEVHTSAAVAGVRGTMFSVGVGADGTTRTVVEEGKVSLATEKAESVLEANHEGEADLEGNLTSAREIAQDKANWEGWFKARAEAVARDRAGFRARLQKLFLARREALNANLAEIDSFSSQMTELAKKARLLRNSNQHDALAKLIEKIRENCGKIDDLDHKANRMRIAAMGLREAMDRLEESSGQQPPGIKPGGGVKQGQDEDAAPGRSRFLKSGQIVKAALLKHIAKLRALRKEFNLGTKQQGGGNQSGEPPAAPAKKKGR